MDGEHWLWMLRQMQSMDRLLLPKTAGSAPCSNAKASSSLLDAGWNILQCFVHGWLEGGLI
jgi:hypothetical protein